MAYQQRPSNHNEDQDQNRRLYNPYQDLQVPIQNIYKLPTSPEFLFQEESLHQRRSWGENLTYYTGIGYLSGAVTGAGKGLIDGIKASEPGDTLKLRANRILNSSGHTGRKFGNRAGVIGLLYAGMESGMMAVRDTDDVINSVVAGLGTGALYKAASGPRSAAVAGAIGGVVVGLAVTGKQFVGYYDLMILSSIFGHEVGLECYEHGSGSSSNVINWNKIWARGPWKLLDFVDFLKAMNSHLY
ncbi:unnamed protein product [Ilex paraguariensis]|uniref:Uncharacterized protein n=1 Tax=Ilex paraguariensis TaxID=185542 RepID=A0ABC8UFY2_9AQUA